MQTASARYGRPKGTGLDDRKRLESIAAALVADPKLRPTTAIRALGQIVFGPPQPRPTLR